MSCSVLSLSLVQLPVFDGHSVLCAHGDPRISALTQVDRMPPFPKLFLSFRRRSSRRAFMQDGCIFRVHLVVWKPLELLNELFVDLKTLLLSWTEAVSQNKG